MKLNPVFRRICMMTLVGAAANLSLAQTTPLGPLFYTSAQREAMALARGGTAVPNAKTTPDVLRVDGLLLRSKGPASVWVNGELLDNNSQATRMAVSIEGGAVRLNGGVKLKVGQAVEPGGQGQVQDLLEEGSLKSGGVPIKLQSAQPGGLRLTRSSPKAGAP